MKITITKGEAEALIKKGLLIPLSSKGEYTLELASYLDLKRTFVPITIQYEDDSGVDLAFTHKSQRFRSVEEWYHEFVKVFPMNDKHGEYRATKILRSDLGNRGLVKFKNLVLSGISPELIVEAVKYEVWFRKEQSTDGDNKLKYLAKMSNWLDNKINIESQIELMQKDTEYLYETKQIVRKIKSKIK